MDDGRWSTPSGSNMYESDELHACTVTKWTVDDGQWATTGVAAIPTLPYPLPCVTAIVGRLMRCLFAVKLWTVDNGQCRGQNASALLTKRATHSALTGNSPRVSGGWTQSWSRAPFGESTRTSPASPSRTTRPPGTKRNLPESLEMGPCGPNAARHGEPQSQTLAGGSSLQAPWGTRSNGTGPRSARTGHL
jgi:hypothetical protein